MTMDNMINQIVRGDCLDVMKRIENESIDMILCDLPYGTTQNKWDSVIPIMALWNQYKRIIKRNGAIVLTAQVPFDKRLGSTNLSMLRYEWIWEKDAGTGFLNANRMPLKNHENVLIFYRELPTYNPQKTVGQPYTTKKAHHGTNYGRDTVDEVITKNDGDRFPLTVLKFNRDKPSVHPTQKPVALFEYLIRTYTNENDLVLDNCIGSGTTAIASLNTNRRFIGIELDPNYHQIAVNRVNEWHRERELQKEKSID
jgi:site-specific DNA-methyltransferase (adenine-specific)